MGKEKECRDQMVTLLVPPIGCESQRMMVVMLVPSIGFESLRMMVVMVVMLVQPKGFGSQRMMMMMSRTGVCTHSWDCDCVGVVVVSLRWY